VPCPENDEVEAVVTGFSKSGEIAFSTNEKYGTITFKLSLEVWFGLGSPSLNQVVILSGIAKFQRGWRAAKARSYNLADETHNSAKAE
jgi:hypothetical protein